MITIQFMNEKRTKEKFRRLANNTEVAVTTASIYTGILLNIINRNQEQYLHTIPENAKDWATEFTSIYSGNREKYPEEIFTFFPKKFYETYSADVTSYTNNELTEIFKLNQR